MSNPLKSISHQDIIVHESNDNDRTRLVRQERFGLADWKSFLVVGDKRYEVLNYSTFGLAILSKEKINAEENLRLISGIFEIEGAQIQKLDLKAVYEQVLGDKQVKTAFEVIGKPLDVEQIASALEGLSLVRNIVSNQSENEAILPNFKRLVFEIKDAFAELNDALRQVEREWQFASPQVKKAKERGFGIVVGGYLNDTVNKYLSSIERQLAELDDNSKTIHLKFFRNKLSAFLWEAPMAHRAFFKPHGYAGDFEMMNLIYRDDYEGKDLFAKILHKYYVSQAAAKSVKNRVPFLMNKILKKVSESHVAGRPFKVLSVASGPAYEIQKLLENYGKDLPHLHITLFDQDLKALQHAQQKMREIILQRGITNVQIHYQHSAVRNLIVNGMREKFDFIYSAGLFDYFSESVFIACARQLYAAIERNGALLIGNFDINNPTRGVMEVVLDWNLIYRSKNDIKQLALAVCSDFEIDVEPEGINLFVEMKKNLNGT